MTSYKFFIIYFFLKISLYAAGNKYREFTAKCMGTEFRIIIDHDNEKLCQNAADSAFEEADRLNQIFSDYIADSEISLLSESSFTGRNIKLSDELFEVLKYSKSLAIKTDNAFDPTIGQLSRLWRISRFRKSLPSKKSIDRAVNLKGIENLQLIEKSKEAALKKPGIVLDLGGIAKGYTADMMLKSLNESGVERCLIDAGGDLTLGKRPRGELGWKIEVGGKKHPDLPILSLENCSIATSGDSSQFVEINGSRFSHIMNPATGHGLKTLSQVTIIAENGMKADSLATACSVMGLSLTKQLSKKENFEAYFIIQTSEGKTLHILN